MSIQCSFVNTHGMQCPNMGSSVCERHRCIFVSSDGKQCENVKDCSNTRFCSEHIVKCKYVSTDENGKKITCDSSAMYYCNSGGEYKQFSFCDEHKCMYGGCDEQRVGEYYCEKHTKLSDQNSGKTCHYSTPCVDCEHKCELLSDYCDEHQCKYICDNFERCKNHIRNCVDANYCYEHTYCCQYVNHDGTQCCGVTSEEPMTACEWHTCKHYKPFEINRHMTKRDIEFLVNINRDCDEVISPTSDTLCKKHEDEKNFLQYEYETEYESD